MMVFNNFLKSISPKLNEMEWLKIEMTFLHSRLGRL